MTGRVYRIASPIATHWRPASCADVDCPAWANGWATVVDEGTVLGQGQADYIRAGAGRRYTEDRISGGRTRFTFDAGQPCFRAVDHRVPLDRPEVYTVATAAGTSRHRNGADWVDDFSTHLDHLKTLQQKG